MGIHDPRVQDRMHGFSHDSNSRVSCNQRTVMQSFSMSSRISLRSIHDKTERSFGMVSGLTHLSYLRSVSQFLWVLCLTYMLSILRRILLFHLHLVGVEKPLHS